jgi:hypothetical protein
MSFDVTMPWGLSLVALSIWIWALVTFFKTPRAGFATSLERTLMLYIVIFLGLFGALGWLFAVRPLIRSRLIELNDESTRQPMEAWRTHFAP